MPVQCEGYKIAYSQIDTTCEECRVKDPCKTETHRKLLTAKLEGGTPMETPTQKQLQKLLDAADKKKEVAMINKKFEYGCKFNADMTIEEAKELIMATAFPPDDDGFEVTDDDDFTLSDDEVGEAGGDDLDGFEEAAGAGEEAGSDEIEIPDDELDDNPDADSGTAGEKADEKAGDTQDTIPEGMDQEEYDSLLARIGNIEKRLDDIYGILSETKAKGKGKAKPAAEAGSELADPIEKLKAGMPYSEEALKKMKAPDIKKLCKGIEINSFQKKVIDLIPQILDYQAETFK